MPPLPEGRYGVLRWGFDPEPPAERRRRSGWLPRNLRKPGFRPATLIDVGAGQGTPVLYRAFPDAYRVLIEPLREFEQQLERWVVDQKGECVFCAIGDESGDAAIHVDPDCLYMSSLHRTTWERPQPTRPRRVQLTTLDKLLEDRRWRPPFGLKIDTEGHEDRVIRGAARVLEQTQFVIAEVSVAARFDEGYAFAEFIGLMEERGFKLSDVIDGAKLEGRDVLYLDLLFRRGAEGTARLA